MKVSLIRSYTERLKSLLEFNYHAEEITTEYQNGEEVEVDSTDFISLTSKASVIFSVEAIQALQQIGQDATVLLTIGDDPIASRDNSPKESIWNIRTLLVEGLTDAILDLTREVYQQYPDSISSQILEAFFKELERFKVFVLEEDLQQVKTKYRNLWGDGASVETQRIIKCYHTDFKNAAVSEDAVVAFGDSVQGKLVDLSMVVLAEVIDHVQRRIQRILSVLDKESTTASEVTSNGIFFYQGPVQVNRIQQFITYDNAGLVPKNQQKDWVEFLSGQSIPKEPITWLGPKQHFILLIRHITYLKGEQPSRPLPIELMGKQPSWIKLSPLIVFKDGKPLDIKDTFRSYDSLKDLLNNTARYIKDLYSSYKGEE